MLLSYRNVSKCRPFASYKMRGLLWSTVARQLVATRRFFEIESNLLSGNGSAEALTVTGAFEYMCMEERAVTVIHRC